VPFVSLPYITAEGRGGPPQPGIYGGWLGHSYDPLIVTNDPNSPTFGIPELTLRAEVDPARLDDRKALLAQLNRPLVATEQSAATQLMDSYQQKAFTLLHSDATRRAFDLSRESPRLRDAYGRNIYGQSVLLSRRLVEAGTRMITLKWAPDANATWDTHGQNFAKLKNELLPQLDAALGTLLEDLHDRGLLDETLVLCLGEFGRSPKVNKDAGRDHWPRCYSLLLAGGGVKGGCVFGASDRIGSDPAENPVTPHDLIATFYSLLGIPADTQMPDQLGKPVHLVGSGQVISELLV
jgi:arylsulfatase A-like enzyme